MPAFAFLANTRVVQARARRATSAESSQRPHGAAQPPAPTAPVADGQLRMPLAAATPGLAPDPVSEQKHLVPDAVMLADLIFPSSF